MITETRLTIDSAAWLHEEKKKPGKMKFDCEIIKKKRWKRTQDDGETGQKNQLKESYSSNQKVLNEIQSCSGRLAKMTDGYLRNLELKNKSFRLGTMEIHVSLATDCIYLTFLETMKISRNTERYLVRRDQDKFVRLDEEARAQIALQKPL